MNNSDADTMTKIIRSIEEAADNANLMALNMVMKAFESDLSSAIRQLEGANLHHVAEKAMNATCEIEQLVKGLRGGSDQAISRPSPPWV